MTTRVARYCYQRRPKRRQYGFLLCFKHDPKPDTWGTPRRTRVSSPHRVARRVRFYPVYYIGIIVIRTVTDRNVNHIRQRVSREREFRFVSGRSFAGRDSIGV